MKRLRLTPVGCFVALSVVVAGIIVCVCLAAFLWYASADRTRPLVETELRNLRAQGKPVDDQSLDAWYRSRTDNTNTQKWLEIQAAIESAEFKELRRGVELLDPEADGTGWTAQGWPGEQKARQLLARSADIRQRIHELAAEPRAVYFPIQFNSARTLTPSTEAHRSVARLIDVERQAALEDRDSVGVAKAIQTELNLSLVCSKEPFTTSHLVCTSIYQLAMRGIKNAIEVGCLETPDVDQLMQSLPAVPLQLETLSELAEGERGVMLPIFFDTSRFPSELLPEFAATVKLPKRATYVDTWHYLQLMRSIAEIDTETLEGAMLEAEGIDRKLSNDMRQAGILRQREWFITGLVSPATSAVVREFCEAKVMRNLAMHGLAVRRFQLQFNRLPTELEELKAIGFDTHSWMPIGKKPMGYQRDGGDAILWATSRKDGQETSPTPPDLDPEQPLDDRRSALVWRSTP